jgi:hypothetical protein
MMNPILEMFRGFKDAKYGSDDLEDCRSFALDAFTNGGLSCRYVDSMIRATRRGALT